MLNKRGPSTDPCGIPFDNFFPATKATTYFDSLLSLIELTVNEFETVYAEAVSLKFSDKQIMGQIVVCL